MKSPIIIEISSATLVTKKVFTEKTGLSLSLVNRMIADGRLLVQKNGREGSNAGVLVNILKYNLEAVEAINKLSPTEQLIIKIT